MKLIEFDHLLTLFLDQDHLWHLTAYPFVSSYSLNQL
jgi:hypothetical protein